MGLAVSTGLLAELLINEPDAGEWLSMSLTVVNRVLSEHALPQHDEPRIVPKTIRRDGVDGFPYSFLHYLRRAYAHRLRDGEWTADALGENETPTNDSVLENAILDLQSHLLCHSDCEGFYVPIDFPDVLFDEKDELEGGMLGSSYRLKDELVFVAPALGIVLQHGELSDQEVDRINTQAETDQGIFRELMVWICLFEACNESIAHKTAICFG